MELDVYTQDGIKIINLTGELNSATAEDVQERVQAHIGEREHVVLNMQNVSYMSSAGIRTLLLLYRAVHESGGRAALVGLSEDLEETLDITGFLEYFNTHATLDEGIRAIR
ncbi:MAG: STAS domain-containing protein [Chloroflexota bacterium]